VTDHHGFWYLLPIVLNWACLAVGIFFAVSGIRGWRQLRAERLRLVDAAIVNERWSQHNAKVGKHLNNVFVAMQHGDLDRATAEAREVGKLFAPKDKAIQ